MSTCRHPASPRTHSPLFLNFLNRPLACFGCAHHTTAGSSPPPRRLPDVTTRARGFTTALRYSSDRALSERLPPPPSQHSATSYSVLCPIAAAAANGRRGRNSASFRVLQRNATVARPCPVDRRVRAAPLHMLAGKPETAFWRESTERQQRLACSAWDGCRTAGEGSGARTG